MSSPVVNQPTVMPVMTPQPSQPIMTQQEKTMKLFNQGLGFGLTGFTIIIYMLINMFNHKNYRHMGILLLGILFFVIGMFYMIQYLIMTNPMMLMN